MGTLTTVTYKIRELRKTPQVGERVDVVNNVMWSVVGTDGTNTVILEGSSPLEFNEATFTDLNLLTESKVLGWVADSIGLEGDALMRVNLQKELDILDGIVESEPMPWS